MTSVDTSPAITASTSRKNCFRLKLSPPPISLIHSSTAKPRAVQLGGEQALLVFQVRPLGHAGNTTVGNGFSSGFCCLWQNCFEICCRVIAPVGGCSVRSEHSLSVPSLQRLHGNVYSLAKFARCIHVPILHTFGYIFKS